MELFDAHRHPGQDIEKVEQSVVNGTHPEDWTRVLHLADEHRALIAAIGLHPIKLSEAPSDWKQQLLDCLSKASVIGEIGLDYRDETADIEAQLACFDWQLTQAAERNLPVSIHCVKAFDDLHARVKEGPVPQRGVHLHAFNGSAEQARQFIKLGAYFSFNAAQLHPDAKKAPAALREVPEDRLLMETDAEASENDLPDSFDRLQQAYTLAAEIRGADPDRLGTRINENFKRYFLDD